MKAIPLVVALGVALQAIPVQAEPAARPRTTVAVDTSGVGEAGPIIQRRVTERADVVLRDAEVLPADSADDPVIHIDVKELTGENPGFALDLWVEREGDTLGERRRVECNLCTETEIVAKAETEIAAMVEALPGLQDAARRDDPAAAEPATTPSPMTTTPSEPETDRRPLGIKGKAGLGLIVAGLVGTGAGIGLAIDSWEPLEGDASRERSTRPIGIGLAAGGGAVLVAGAVLLGLDRRKRPGKKASALIRPSRRGITIGVSGRF